MTIRTILGYSYILTISPVYTNFSCIFSAILLFRLSRVPDCRTCHSSLCAHFIIGSFSKKLLSCVYIDKNTIYYNMYIYNI